MTDDSVIELELFRPDSELRCSFCGDTAVVCHDRTQDDSIGLRACYRCVEAGQDRLDEWLNGTAAAAEASARTMRGLTPTVALKATMEAWEGHAKTMRALLGRVKLPSREALHAWEAAKRTVPEAAVEAADIPL